MVGKRKRRGRSQGLLGSHQKCWLWGRHVVLETLRAGRWLPLEIQYDPAVLPAEFVQELQHSAGAAEIPVSRATSDILATLSGARDHQGLLARMPEYPYVALPELMAQLHANSFVLVLCGIQDPFNFGSILRSADLFGVKGVVVPEQGQAAVSSHVARSSVGAVNYLPIAEVTSLAESCRELKRLGLKLIAATEKGTVPLNQADLGSGVALLIGNEGTGVPDELQTLCDQQVRIPMQGHVGSLNAAVAAGILCYEVQNRRIADR